MKNMANKKPKDKLSLAKKVGVYGIGILILATVYMAGLTQGYLGRLSVNTMARVFNEQVRGRGETATTFGMYWQVLDLVQNKFFGSINPQELVYGSIKGMVAALGDRYTVFTDPEENRQFFDGLDGVYEGVGLEIDIIQGQLVVTAPLKGSPAEAAGFRSNDQIVAVNGETVNGLTLDDVVAKIKGPSGTKVSFTVVRGTEEFDVEVTRQIIKRDSVEYEVGNDGIATISIYRFANDTERLLNTAAANILTKNAKGIVLDLRNNPGGFLEAGVAVADEFIKSGVIVEERFRDGTRSSFTADGMGSLTSVPMVVLINQGSASASEIVAGAIQDAKRGKIVGERSYGKGSVQEVEDLPDGSALRVTVAEWFTPAGRSISDAGITPDVVVENPVDSTVDAQLEAAKKLLLG